MAEGHTSKQLREEEQFAYAQQVTERGLSKVGAEGRCGRRRERCLLPSNSVKKWVRKGCQLLHSGAKIC